MSKNTVSKISNAFSTGGGGVNFEQQIQAMFLLSLLVDGYCPVTNEPTVRVCFQTKHSGYDTDDLAVFTARGKTEGKMLCQIKHSITATENDNTFQEVILAAWSDFNKEFFDKGHDVLALAVAQIANKSQQSLRFLHAQAVGSVDASDFVGRVKDQNYSNSDNEKMLRSINNIISRAKGCQPSQEESWTFFKSFVLLLFDLDCAESINRSLSSALIKSHSALDAILVWSKLVEYASLCNQKAASIDRNNIETAIRALFETREIIHMPPAPIQKIDLFIPTIALIGSWDESNSYDQQIIEHITGEKYSEFEAKARAMLVQESNYLRLQNSYWTVFHKDDLLDQCKGLLFDSILEKIIEATETILLQESKNYINGERQLFVAKEFDYSESLRNSLLKSICWIKKGLIELPQCSFDKINNRIDQMVAVVLKDGDQITWISIRNNIQCLAELAPDIFIKKLEWCIVNKQKVILRLFPQNNSSIFGGTNCIANILWALETLAWSPDYLTPAICTLGLLETVPYEKTNWANTPINSIVSILLPWYPQTLADVEKRKNAMRCLNNENGEVFWNVLVKLLPNQTSSTSGNPRPQVLALKIPEKITVSNKDLYEQYSYYLKLAVEISGVKVEKIMDLTRQMEYMDESTLFKYLDCIVSKDAFDDRQRLELWISLRECVARYKHDNKTVFSKNIKRVQEVIAVLEPKESVQKYQELYLGNSIFLDTEDYANQWNVLERKKIEAVNEIFTNYGISAIEQFGIEVKNTYDVAIKLGQSLESTDISCVIDSFDSGKLSSEFTIACISSFVYSFGAHKLLETSLCHKSEACILEILSGIQVSVEMIEVVGCLLKNDSTYWQKVRVPYGLRGKEAEALRIYIPKLITSKRYVAALNLIGRSDFSNVFEANEICYLLKLVGTEKTNESEIIDNYATQRVIKWIQVQENISLESRSDIDFIYLPLLDDYSGMFPRALYTRLSTDPDYFCSMLEMCYKKNSEEESEAELNEGLQKRLFMLLFQYKATPGVGWNGHFDEENFKKWLEKVKAWSIENDRYAVAMHTVGSGLSYGKLDKDGLPNKTIIEELNKAENDDLRRGYYLGVVNQRGVHTIDPEGKPEYELAAQYDNKANIAEARGYSRFAGVLKDISISYVKEAEHNKRTSKLESIVES